jgi:hypothetical protein
VRRCRFSRPRRRRRLTAMTLPGFCFYHPFRHTTTQCIRDYDMRKWRCHQRARSCKLPDREPAAADESFIPRFLYGPIQNELMRYPEERCQARPPMYQSCIAHRHVVFNKYDLPRSHNARIGVGYVQVVGTEICRVSVGTNGGFKEKNSTEDATEIFV